MKDVSQNFKISMTIKCHHISHNLFLFCVFIVAAEVDANEQRCQLPLDLNNTIITRHLHENDAMNPGDFVDHYQIVYVKCDINNVITYVKSLLCRRGALNRDNSEMQ